MYYLSDKVTKDDLIDFLDSVIEYMQDRADADHNGMSFVPNKEMNLLTEASRILDGKWEFAS